MEAKINEEKSVELASTKHIKVTPYGIEFDGHPSPEEWIGIVNNIRAFHGKYQFYLGDLVIFAEIPETSGWGESKYTELMEATGYSYDRLSQCARMSRAYPIEFRKRSLTSTNNYPLGFEHFVIAFSLPETHREYYLQLASENEWGVRKFREEVAKVLGKDQPKEEQPIGIRTFREIGRGILNGYIPQHDNQEYDTITWLLEMKDFIEERLEELEVIDE